MAEPANGLADQFYYLNLGQLGILAPPSADLTSGGPTRTVRVQLSGVTQAQETHIVQLARLNTEFIAALQRGDPESAAALLVRNVNSLLVIFLHQCFQCQDEALPEQHVAIMRQLAASPKAKEAKEIILQWMNSYYTSTQSEKVIGPCCKIFFTDDGANIGKLELLFCKIAFVHRDRSQIARGFTDLLGMIEEGNILGAHGWCQELAVSFERQERIICLWMELAMQRPDSAPFFGNSLDFAKTAGFMASEKLAIVLKSAFNCRNISDWRLSQTLWVNKKVLALASPQLAAAQDTRDSCFEEAVRFVYTGELVPAPQDMKKLAIYAYRLSIPTLTRKIQLMLEAEGQLELARELYDFLGQADASWHTLLKCLIGKVMRKSPPQSIQTFAKRYGQYLTELDLAVIPEVVLQNRVMIPERAASDEGESPEPISLITLVGHFLNVREVSLTSKCSRATLVPLEKLTLLDSIVIPETVSDSAEFDFCDLAQIDSLRKVTIKQTDWVRLFASTGPANREFHALLKRLSHLVLHPEWSPGSKTKLSTLIFCDQLDYLDIRCWSKENVLEVFRAKLANLLTLRLSLPKEADKVAPLFAQKEFPRLENLILEGPFGLEIIDNIAYPELRSLQITCTSKEFDQSVLQQKLGELFKRCYALASVQFNGQNFTRGAY